MSEESQSKSRRKTSKKEKPWCFGKMDLPFNQPCSSCEFYSECYKYTLNLKRWINFREEEI